MARLNFRNTFASQNSKLDLQRGDLFKMTLSLPTVLGLDWTENVEFALEKFPFPERSREMIGVKYMQQTNFMQGGDTPTPAIDIPVRYAFGQRTAESLEKWNQLCSNQRTGGVGLTSEIKAKGVFRWLIPNMTRQVQDLRGNVIAGENTMLEGLTYELEGCMIKGFRFVDADMTTSAPINIIFSLQIDRYYPANLNEMQFSV